MDRQTKHNLVLTFDRRGEDLWGTPEMLKSNGALCDVVTQPGAAGGTSESADSGFSNQPPPWPLVCRRQWERTGTGSMFELGLIQTACHAAGLNA